MGTQVDGRAGARVVTCAPPGARGRRRPASAARRPPLRAPCALALRLWLRRLLGSPLRIPRRRGRPRHVRREGRARRSAAPALGPARLTPPPSASGGRRPAHCNAQARRGRGRARRTRHNARRSRNSAWRLARRFATAGGAARRLLRFAASPMLSPGNTEDARPRGRARAGKGPTSSYTLVGMGFRLLFDPRPTLPSPW